MEQASERKQGIRANRDKELLTFDFARLLRLRWHVMTRMVRERRKTKPSTTSANTTTMSI